MKRMRLDGTFFRHTRTWRQLAVDLLWFALLLILVLGAVACVAMMPDM